MTNQTGSANWTCPSCGAMASVLDSKCPHCKTARSAATTQPLPTAPTTQTAPINPVTPTSSAPAAAAVAGETWQAVRTSGGGMWRRLEAWIDAPTRAADAAPRQRGVAIALGFLGGIVGAQHFYMGRRVLGVLSVVLCWTMWPAAIGWMDATRMLFMTEQEFQRACR